jgi:hypothetical protein
MSILSCIIIHVGENHCTSGTNSSNIVCCEQGFTCTPGWDPVTGFGSIDFKKFYDIMTALPSSSSIPTRNPTISPSLTPSISYSSVPTLLPSMMSDSPNNSDSKYSSTKFSGGEIFGIAIAILIGLCFLVTVFYHIVLYLRSRK